MWSYADGNEEHIVQELFAADAQMIKGPSLILVGEVSNSPCN